MFQFLTGLGKRQLAVAEVWVKMTTFPNVGFVQQAFLYSQVFTDAPCISVCLQQARHYGQGLVV